MAEEQIAQGLIRWINTLATDPVTSIDGLSDGRVLWQALRVFLCIF